MKSKFPAVLLLSSGAWVAMADVASPPVNGSAPRLSYSVVEIGPHHRVWEAPDTGTSAPNAAGGWAGIWNRTHRVVEVASGMNYWDGQQWSPSQASFDVEGNAFVASKVYHNIRLGADVSAMGAVTESTPDGTTLTSTPVGIGLYDPVSGQSIVLAAITNSQGVMLSSNKVVYENAFSGLVSADVVYTLEKGSFQQDVVLTTTVNPADYGFSDKARIQIYTEFYGAPVPEVVRRPLYIEKAQSVRQSMVTPDLVDYTLSFGAMTFGAGRAFMAPGGVTNSAVTAPVAKEYIQTPDGRTILIESVECSAIKRALQALPQGGTHASAKGAKHLAGKALYAAIPKPPLAAKSVTRMKPHSSERAKAGPGKHPGLVIDYVETVGTYNDPYVFQGDTTYFVSGPAYFNDTVTIEGGAVFKYPLASFDYGTNLVYTAYIEINGDLVVATASYRPAVFTAGDDDTVGESLNGVMDGYTGDPSTNSYASPALWLSGSQSTLSLTNLRFCYAANAILVYVTSQQQVTLAHSQVINCLMGIAIYGSGMLVQANNCLFSNVGQPFEENAIGGYDNTWGLSQCTVDTASQLLDSNGSTLSCTNCIFGSVSNTWSSEPYLPVSGQNNGFYNTDTFGYNATTSGSSPFQSVGAAGYYLAPDSTFRSAGTTNIDPTLLADLQKKTTYPPIVYSNTAFYADTTFAPQVQRGFFSSAPLGYLYDPLDFIFEQVQTIGSITISVTPGTAIAEIGYLSTNYGLGIGDNAKLLCQGTATSPVRLISYNSVQESHAGGPVHGPEIVADTSTNAAGVLDFQFTQWCSPAQDFYAVHTHSDLDNLQDCELHGGLLYASTNTMNLTNCLFERVNGYVYSADGNVPAVRNNTFFGGELGVGISTLTNMVIRDNLFDHTSLTNYLSQGYIGGWNAFVTNCNRLTPTNIHDVVLSASPSYESGTFGSYYLPTNSILTNAGSVTANLVGLYHYTVLTNGLPETTNTVSIGYHYVAVDAIGNPLDTNSDGIPDYLEDANGNGLVDSGEIAWNIVGDPGLTVIITRPAAGSTLP
jgi:hypothetical protein